MVQIETRTLTIHKDQSFEMATSFPHENDHSLATPSFIVLGYTFHNMHQIMFRKNLKAVPINSNRHPLTPIALGILYPGTSICELIKIHNMPEKALEDRIEKENAYRNLILNTFSLKEIMADRDSALRAVISSISPDIDPNSEAITARILRGDLVEHLQKNPGRYHVSGDELDSWKSRATHRETTAGFIELEMLSDFLERQIYIYSYENPSLGLDGGPQPAQSGRLGDTHDAHPLNLYYDPVRKHFLPMQLRCV